MTNNLSLFESFVRNSNQTVTQIQFDPVIPRSDVSHPFDERNIHSDIFQTSLKLFDDGHYSNATFEAYKYIDKQVQQLSKSDMSGVKLMMSAFAEKSPLIQLTKLSNSSEKDEQKGFQFLFSGAVSAIRNPRGHEVGNIDTIDECLDHLSLASFLLRRLSSCTRHAN